VVEAIVQRRHDVRTVWEIGEGSTGEKIVAIAARDERNLGGRRESRRRAD